MPKITLKRVTNTDGTAVELYPTTTLDQIISEGTGANSTDESLTSYLSSTYVPQSQKGAASGVATLDSDSKLTASQIPDYLLGGLYFQQAISAPSAGGYLAEETFATALNAAFTARDGDVDLDNMTGTYFIAGNNFTLPTVSGSQSQSGGSGTGIYWGWDSEEVFAEGNQDGNDLEVQTGDWLIIQGNSGGDGSSSTPYTFDISVVNNTYKDAATNAKGIVQLISTSANAGSYNNPNNMVGLVDGSNRVVTEDFLFGNRASGELNSGANGANQTSNKLAMSNHIHDGRYYTETEIGSFFGGSASITGYNKSNWDAAYNDKINSASFDDSNGVLTLTQQDNGTVTVDLDGRYAESVAVTQTDGEDGLDVSVTGDTYTLKHHDTSSIADVTNTDGNVIQSATFDTFGHILTQTSVDLDGRYYTESEFNDWLDGTAIDGHNFTEIKYGASPSGTVVGTILIDVDE